jgi:hypothetical protein
MNRIHIRLVGPYILSIVAGDEPCRQLDVAVIKDLGTINGMRQDKVVRDAQLMDPKEMAELILAIHNKHEANMENLVDCL